MSVSDFRTEGSTLIKYTGSDPHVVVPEGIKEIYDFAFADGKCLVKSIVFPESLDEIGKNVLANCTHLESVIIPDSVKSIDEGAFSSCKNIESVTLPEGITQISDGLFSGCKKLKTMVIPQGVTKIGNDAFCNCQSLESVYIPDTVESIGTCAFQHCENLKSVVLPDNLKKIGSYGFAFCSSLESINISDSVSIGSEAFNGCLSLIDEDGFVIVRDVLYGYYGDEHVVTIPENIKVVDSYSFANCEDVVQVHFTENVTKIGSAAFCGCINLTSIIIPDGVKKIDNWAFEKCERLTSVTIPETVTEIGSVAFGSCASLKTVAIPESVKKIGISAFANCTALSLVEFSSAEAGVVSPGATEICDGAFEGCTNLSTIIFRCGLKSMSKYAFVFCDNLRNIVLPEGITDFWRSALENLWHCFSKTEFKHLMMLSLIRQYAHLIRDNRYVSRKIKANRDKIFAEILRDEDVQSLNILFSFYKKISLEKVNEYINLSAGKTTITAFLLEYKNKNYSPKACENNDFENL